MRKFFLITCFLLSIGLLIVSPNRNVIAQTGGTGEQCRADGGNCRNYCLTGENDWGEYDCPETEVGPKCCFPTSVTPPQKPCGASCVNASQCPSGCQACQELVQGQGKICRDCPATGCQITPAPINYCGRSCWGNDANCGDPCPHCVPYAGGSWCQAEEAPTPTPTTGPGGGEGGSIRTAIGDIDPRNLQGFIQQLLNLALGVAGGIAFLLMLFGAFQIMTSSGNPEKMKSGSELITSALAGLLFIIFSIFLLKLIGVEILEIPGFGQ